MSNPQATYYAKLYPGEQEPVEPQLGLAVERLQKCLQMPVWLLVQDGRSKEFESMGDDVSTLFYACRRSGFLPKERIALVIDSYGGQASSAFEVAKVLQRHCGGFLAVIPRHAKSAATLLALGADNILMGRFGELGPLDVQVADPEREERISGLDEVQALERLHAFVLAALDKTMFMMCARTSMKVGTLLPQITRLVTDMVRPLFEKIDVVRYTQMSRSLKIGEEYARRLLSNRFNEQLASSISRGLVENYPEHSFVIDIDEVREIGLDPMEGSQEQLDALDDMADACRGATVIGPVTKREVPHESEKAEQNV